MILITHYKKHNKIAIQIKYNKEVSIPLFLKLGGWTPEL